MISFSGNLGRWRDVLPECVESDKTLCVFELKKLYERLPMEFSIDNTANIAIGVLYALYTKMLARLVYGITCRLHH